MKTAPWVNNLYPASLLFAYDLGDRTGECHELNQE